jgi:hypothetical protein
MGTGRIAALPDSNERGTPSYGVSVLTATPDAPMREIEE